MTDVFCSYRRKDTGDVVLKIVDRLRHAFGEHAVYLDVQDEPLGSAFENRILKSISDSRLVLVFIGSHWSERLSEVSDMVRREVEMALTFNVPLVPVLVGLPDLGRVELPRQLSELRGLNWMTLDPTLDFDESVLRLTRHVESVLYEMRLALCPVEQEVPVPWGTNPNDPAYFYHLSVENLSNRELKDVVVQVTKTQVSEGPQNNNGPTYRIERPLFWELSAGERTKIDIPAGPHEKKRNCNLARLKKQDRKLALDISGDWPVHEPHVLLKGRMQVELDARSAQGRARPLVIDIDYDGGWSDRGVDMVGEKHLMMAATPKYSL